MSKQRLCELLQLAKFGSLIECNLERVMFHYTDLDELVSDACTLNTSGFDAVSNSNSFTLTVSPE